MRILHLSDLHFGLEKTQSELDQRKNCFDTLINVIEKENSKNQIDYVVITGDIGWKGISTDYSQASGFINSIIQKTKIGNEKVIICPGNHDVNRENAIYMQTPNNFDESLKLLNVEGINKWADEFSAFIDFCNANNYAKPQIRKDVDSKYLVGYIPLGDTVFIILNTAWTAKSDESEGKLWIGNSFWETIEASDEIKQDKLIITLMHHPESSLNPADHGFYQGLVNTYHKIQIKSSLILCGHTHESKIVPKPIRGGGQLISCGTTYSGHTYTNSFSIIEILDNNINILPYEFLNNEWEEKKVIPETINKKILAQNMTTEPHSEKEVYQKLLDLGFSIENCSVTDFIKPGKLLWPVVPRKCITYIHQGQIELMSLMSNLFGWSVEILISDCGSKAERLKASGIASFRSELISYLEKRNVKIDKINFMSSFFNKENPSNSDILEKFVTISSSIKKHELEGLKNKKYNETVITENNSLPVLDYIFPLLQMAVVSHLGKTYASSTGCKSLIVAGNDELTQWRYVMREMVDSKLGVVLIPALRDSYNCDYWQQEIKKYLSCGELTADIKSGNFAYWIYILFIVLQQLNNIPPLSRYEMDDATLKYWINNQFQETEKIDYIKLAEAAWNTFSLLV